MEWEPLFNEAGVPAGRVLTVPEALDLEQVRLRGLVHHFDHVDAVGRPLSVSLGGYRIRGHDTAPSAPPPALGEHTDAVLAEIGCSADEISRLRSEGIV